MIQKSQTPITRIVVIALDHSSNSQQAFDWSLKNFLRKETDLAVLVNVRQIPTVPVPYAGKNEVVTSLEEQHRINSHTLLQEYAAKLKSHNVDATLNLILVSRNLLEIGFCEALGPPSGDTLDKYRDDYNKLVRFGVDSKIRFLNYLLTISKSYLIENLKDALKLPVLLIQWKASELVHAHMLNLSLSPSSNDDNNTRNFNNNGASISQQSQQPITFVFERFCPGVSSSSTTSSISSSSYRLPINIDSPVSLNSSNREDDSKSESEYDDNMDICRSEVCSEYDMEESAVEGLKRLLMKFTAMTPTRLQSILSILLDNDIDDADILLLIDNEQFLHTLRGKNGSEISRGNCLLLWHGIQEYLKAPKLSMLTIEEIHTRVDCVLSVVTSENERRRQIALAHNPNSKPTLKFENFVAELKQSHRIPVAFGTLRDMRFAYMLKKLDRQHYEQVLASNKSNVTEFYRASQEVCENLFSDEQLESALPWLELKAKMYYK
ncbi:2394_t:CDS:2 [Entrophospora sp. SA101]|nr:2394_t:CDS:2 [Entrophospora sp. SA101]